MPVRGVELASFQGVRITVSGHDIPISDEMRAYAEYRAFTSVAQHAPMIQSVSMTLKRSARGSFQCAIVVDLIASGRVNTQARGARPSAAIDRAAQRAGWLLERRANAVSA